MGRVEASEAVPVPPTTPAPKPTAGFAGSTLSFPELPAAAYTLGSDKERVRQVQEVLDRSRKEALIEIASHLKDTYLHDINKAEAEELAKLKPEKAAAYLRATTTLRGIFESYALKRGRLVAHLSVLAGFPDRDPGSQNPPPANAVVANLRFKTARDLRGQIASLDQDYEKQSSDLFARAGAEVAARLEELQEKFKAMRDAADGRAESDAQAQVSKQQAHLTSVLSERGVVSFPAEPGRTVTVQNAQVPAPPPTVAVAGKRELEGRMRAADLSDLKVWAALNGYVISSTRRGTKDVTSEFIKWKRSHPGSP